ncbi:COBRA-like protein 10 precursor [Perilla frutescens var. hirtella]|uniref:COBRA-like protein 10 n=1 Tax=Perilla frutescens var. hirtella TaxID=608512 RepID=A0AAD4JKP5_PERFH|nr:COBRA-like protein 10 precursor [Perilla frutescens var. hirtella]
MRIPWRPLSAAATVVVLVLFFHTVIEKCNGIFLSYTFEGREREYPFVKNVSGQAWAFQATASILNAGSTELKSWKMFIGFQHNELLVSADGATVVNGDGFPIRVGNNGTVLAGFPNADLKTAIDTASDYTQMQVQIGLKGTQFGVANKVTPMPKSLKLLNDGYKCPAATRKGSYMHVCCKKDPKYKDKKLKTKFFPRTYGDLHFTYDVLKAYDSKYLAQITIDNLHPLGRLDQWNLTWEWMRNEFIYDMRGAFTHRKDPSDCIYGPQGQYYKDFDFSTVMNCQKKPIISDLPPQLENDDKVGKLPFCCRDGVLLPKTMNETKSRAIFQLEVFKLPPDLNRTAINPPQNWKIIGRLNPNYKCGPPVRIDPTEYPDPRGIDSVSSAIASWQVNCNMSRPKPRENRCCVTYSAYYADGAVPCNTCACGCDEEARCDRNAAPMLLPPSSLLVPFANRTAKAIAFAKINKRPVPRKLPCPDNCGVSINWHVDSDYKSGWTARMTVFNWEEDAFADWYSAVQLRKAHAGFEKSYSFNGTRMDGMNHTIFMQGLPGLNYLVGEVNGTHPGRDPMVPGKQQSVLSFSKKGIHGLRISEGDGFPTKLFFNGEECALPKHLPRAAAVHSSPASLLSALLLALLTFLLIMH